MQPQRFPEHGVWCAVTTVCILALAPAIGVGIARFAYSLLLPDMRTSLRWTYAAAGFMNTVNAAGYLIGASIAAPVMRRVGQHGAIVHGSLACVLALALSAVTGNFVVLSSARLAAGIGGAVAFVAGGVATVRIAQRHAGHAAFLVSLYYIGPGLGILLSGLITPALLVQLGPGSWWVGWGVLAVLTAIMCAVLALAPREMPASKIEEAQIRVALSPMLIVVVSYCLFSVGTIAYMTFMIAWLAKAGAGATTQAVFWSLLGLGGICSPFLWSWAIAVLSGGRAIAMLTALTFVAAAIGLSADLRIVQFLSAFIFGSALLAVVAATTAFVRQNYPPAAWPSGVGVMTVAFGLGQMIGPV
ncbi:MAG: YbfB/YjiJ family MFS transporter, partial [Xanthobacteraceae bacterium]